MFYLLQGGFRSDRDEKSLQKESKLGSCVNICMLSSLLQRCPDLHKSGERKPTQIDLLCIERLLLTPHCPAHTISKSEFGD